MSEGEISAGGGRMSTQNDGHEGEGGADSVPTFPEYLQGFLDQQQCFHDPIFPRKVMENPVMIPGDSLSYDKDSLQIWEENCIKMCHFKEENGKRLILSPSSTALPTLTYYDPSAVTENSSLKQALKENERKIREQYIRMFPEAVGDKNLSEVFDAMMTGKPSRGISSPIFADLDNIRKMGLFKALNLKPPQIIVLGSENNGKSTLLERLIGFSIFPARVNALQAGGAMTICPLRVHLRRDSDTIATIKIRNRITGTDRDLRSVPIINISSVLKQIMEDMRNNATKTNPTLVNRPDLIFDEEIVVEITSPTCPNLDILDLPGLCAAEKGSWTLADEILATEGDYSMILMVVKDITINQSTAPALVLKHRLQEKTIGVYTFIDNFKNSEDEESPQADELLLDLFRPPNGKADNFFGQVRVWMGTSNARPSGHATMHESIRLLKTDEKESAFIKSNFPNFLGENIFGEKGKDLLGVPAIRARLEAEYEKYICNNWSCEMISQLQKHFFKLSDKNLCLGLPMLKIEEYGSLVEKLQMVCRENRLFLDYDWAGMFKLYDANPKPNSCSSAARDLSIKDIVVNRASPVCKSLQWMKLCECKDTIYAYLEALDNVKIQPTEIDVDKSYDQAEKVEEDIIRLLEEMAKNISRELGISAGSKFVEAALGNKKAVAVKKTVVENCGTEHEKEVDFDLVWSVPEVAIMMRNVKRFDISTTSSELQTSFLQMELIPGLKEDYLIFINAKIAEVDVAFKEYVEKTIFDLKGKIIDRDHFLSYKDQSWAPKEQVVLKFASGFVSNSKIISTANGPKSIGNAFLDFWNSNLRRKLSSFTEDWVVPESCFKNYINTSAYKMRRKLVYDMHEVVFALRSIKELQKRVNVVSCEFSSAGDTNGVLNLIGTRGDTVPYVTPDVAVFASSIKGGFLDAIVDNKMKFFRTSGAAPKPWVKVDLGQGRILYPNYYSFGHVCAPQPGAENPGWGYLRNWRLEGSNDDVDWTVLKEHKNDETITQKGIYAWPIQMPPRAPQSGFRYFRISMTGKSSVNNDVMLISNLELYGNYTWSSKPAVSNPEKCISMIAECKEGSAGPTALAFLSLVLKNLIDNPAEEKYRSINMEGKAFQDKLCNASVGRALSVSLFLSIGWTKDETGTKLVYKGEPLQLRQYLEKVEAARLI